MPKLLSYPKFLLFLTLLLIYLSNLVSNPSEAVVVIGITAFAFTVFFDLLFTYIKSRKFFTPYAAFVTGAIIALIADPNMVWYQVMVISAVAMAFKVFFRPSNRHVFNPASVGLLIGGILFAKPVAWWGASTPIWGNFSISNLVMFLILLTPGLVSAYKMKRYNSILFFILTYSLITVLLNKSPEVFITSFLDPTILFFSLVMLPEPMTSPVNKKRQIFYGILVAVLTQGISLMGLNFLPDTLIPALLIGNAVFFKFR